MSWIDLVIVVAVIAATERGLRLGAIRQASTTIGFLVGFYVGSLIAPPLALRIDHPLLRSWSAVAIVAVMAALGGALGREAGRAMKVSTRHSRISRLDRLGGALSAALGTLIACWLIAGLLAENSTLSLSSAIAGSRILTVVDAAMPPLPTVEAKVQALLRSTDFPQVFAQVIAPNLPTFGLPSTSETRSALGGAAMSVVKVTATGACGSAHEGTGFVVAPGEVMTAAHVVAGARRTSVNGTNSVVVYFDPRNDVAVLRVHHLNVASLAIWPTVPATGTPAAIAGYPLNRSLTVSPAVVAGSIDASSRDIYDVQLVNRDLVVVDANVLPGNSGSPLLVDARVAGMIFSRSLTANSTAYAVAPLTLSNAMVRAGTTSVSTGTCLAE